LRKEEEKKRTEMGMGRGGYSVWCVGECRWMEGPMREGMVGCRCSSRSRRVFVCLSVFLSVKAVSLSVCLSVEVCVCVCGTQGGTWHASASPHLLLDQFTKRTQKNTQRPFFQGSRPKRSNQTRPARNKKNTLGHHSIPRSPQFAR